MSTPSLFTVSNWVPILGLTKPKINKEIPKLSINNFKKGLNFERLGLNLSISVEWANLFCARRFQRINKK
jgi:hypothetical protein